MTSKITFTRVASDVNGNPRFVCHFLNLNTTQEVDARASIDNKYVVACKRANSIGGRKFNTRAYGGGIVFQSYSLDETVRHIARVTGRDFVGYELT